MFITKLLILTLTIHHICCWPANSNKPNEEGNDSSSQILQLDTPDEFIITKPSITDQVYNEFLNFLYRHDTLKLKSKQKREINWIPNEIDLVKNVRMSR